MHGATDGQVAVQQVELVQDPQPVVLPTTHQRQVLGARVADVPRDVPAVLARPPERDGRRVPVFPAREVTGEREWHQELEERAAEDVQELAERGKDEVTGLVDGEVDVVDEPAVARVRGQETPVGGQRQREHEALVVPSARHRCYLPMTRSGPSRSCWSAGTGLVPPPKIGLRLSEFMDGV